MISNEKQIFGHDGKSSGSTMNDKSNATDVSRDYQDERETGSSREKSCARQEKHRSRQRTLEMIMASALFSS